MQYCVDRVLAGESDSLKERTIGVEVFGRPDDYDTATDHIVRSAASEVRRRLAQYYQEPENARDIRIDIHPGSYIPEFALPEEQRIEPADEAVHAGRSRRWFVAIIAALLVFSGLGAVIAYRSSHRTALDLFWQPVLNSPGPVLLSVGTIARPENPPELKDLTVRDALFQVTQVTYGSAVTLAKLSGFLESRGKHCRFISDANFTDLQGGPSVLIGGRNNRWTLRLNDNLRFIYQSGSIRDRQHPERTQWSVDATQPYRTMAHDYALVSRLRDVKTERITVSLAGLVYWGTIAAGEFLTDPEQMRKLQSSAPKNWERMNIQVVLSTEVVDGLPGPPKVLATHFW